MIWLTLKRLLPRFHEAAKVYGGLSYTACNRLFEQVTEPSMDSISSSARRLLHVSLISQRNARSSLKEFSKTCYVVLNSEALKMTYPWRPGIPTDPTAAHTSESVLQKEEDNAHRDLQEECRQKCDQHQDPRVDPVEGIWKAEWASSSLLPQHPIQRLCCSNVGWIRDSTLRLTKL